jgi:formylglycine-generating enzyme required for sulfatase activity
MPKSNAEIVPVPTPPRSALPKYVIAAVIVVVLVLGGGTYYVVHLSRGGVTPVDQPPTKKPPVENKPPKVTKADLVTIPGGTFMAGRDEGLPQEGPAHSVTVAPFKMDRTEVTNAEYSQFLIESKYTSPAAWINNEPPPGQEQWPVSNVTLEDVNAFAEWRSKRDGTSYRLPTEEEWEFAARSGVSANLYPWGESWDPNYANLGTKVIKPVGSFPDGKDKWGVVDLIGNVWEWTSSKIVLYQGNPNKIPAEQLGWVVIRGGSFSSDATKGKAVTAVTRQWVEPTRRDGLLGFRLVRSGN